MQTLALSLTLGWLECVSASQCRTMHMTASTTASQNV
jgi:hypothetical protein